ncbi:fatty acid desaturase family protein [Dinghuibacter silviterrae]|uniref:Linoleoyl-CoA desaturase n=1 Tax=Dinghuibacter silviterrae TaxID=1539049 RepID=A0A4R8DUV4_9BACT|nr:fatty acid desaturase [Dinghuibacter silviterrae]TDX01698.1 linoleoyl-CoA desaturase [Dinghuibacter silviterrae]
MDSLLNTTFQRQKPVFKKTPDEALFQKMKKRVLARVHELEPRRRPLIIIKALLFPLIYIGAYLSALAWGAHRAVLYGAYLTMGLFLVVIFQNQIHDAVHGSLWRKKWLNETYVHFFDLMGANSFVWRARHVRLHHNFPNVMGWDSDIEQSPLARIFPHGPFKAWHRYQQIYLPMLYPLYLFNWLLVRDFKDYFMRSRPVWKVIRIPWLEYVKLFFFKTFFLGYTIVLPKYVLGLDWLDIAGAFMVLLFSASIFSLLILLSPHANTENNFPLPDGQGRLPYPWFEHQLRHTNDVTQDNWFTRFFLGCFNYHVAHHLFPSINHVYYPEITAIIREEAAQSHLPYRAFPLGKTLWDHYRLLKRNGAEEDIFEEVM